MPLYRYEAVDRTGKQISGFMNVPDDATVSARLATMGYWPLVITLSPGSAPYGSSIRQGPLNTPVHAGGSNLTASPRAISRMFHQLHIVFRAGMTPFQALLTVAGQTPERSLQTALTEMATGATAGKPLSTVMAGYPYLFSRGDVGVVAAGELGGFLPDAIRVLAERHEEEDNARRRLRIWVWFFQANVYGVFLFIPLLVFFTTLASGLAADTGQPLSVEGAVKAGVRAFAVVSLPLALIFSLIQFAFSRYRTRPPWDRSWHAWQLRIPVLKHVIFRRGSAVFTRILQYLMNAGIPAVHAWEAASGSVPNLILGDRYLTGLQILLTTHSLSGAMRHVGLLDPYDVGMVATGEASGEVPEALEYLARRHAEDARTVLNSAVARGAFMCVFWSVMLGLLGVALFWWCYSKAAFSLMDGI